MEDVGAVRAKSNASFARNCSGLVERRNMRDVWTIPPEPLSEEHYAAFPTKLAKRCIAIGSVEGGTVLDPFAGSGTTVLAALQIGREGIGIEINPEYAAMARRRIEPELRQEKLRLEA